VWFGYGNLSYPLIKRVKQLRPGLKVVCDTDGVWSRLVLRELPFESDLTRRLKIEKEGREKEREEKEGVNIADITTTVSEIDADYYRDAAVDPGKVMIFSNGIDVKKYETCPPPTQDFMQPSIVMVGSFYNSLSPMVRGAHWVLDEILPLVKKEIPDIHLYLVGRGSKENMASAQSQDVTATGTLPSVLPYLCNATVAIVPLQFESGTRFKILEAGAARVPIVSTTLGAEGLPIADGEGILLADDAPAFAAGIVKIIKNPDLAAKLTANCYDFIDEYCSLKSLEREAANVLKRLSC
jgi:glycosyltransferase involved in cell wall biosynthesis